MTKLHFALSAVGIAGVVFGGACSRSNEPEPAMRPASGTKADPATRPAAMEGIQLISEARCDREVRCGGVGPDKTYETRDQCVADLKNDGYEDLDAKACPRGLDERQLDQCLSEIHAERCGAPLDTLERLVACRSAGLCKD
jgi:uncharacterized protein DUF6184